MVRHRNSPLLEQIVRRGVLSRDYPVLVDALLSGLFDDSGVPGIKDDVPHCVHEPFVRGLGDLFYPVSVIEEHADEPDPACAGMGAGVRPAGLGPGIAEYTLLGLAVRPVVIGLLVRAGTEADAPGAAGGLLGPEHGGL